MKKLLFALLLAVSASAPGSGLSPGLVNGQIPTAAQWNSYFSAKEDWSAVLDSISAGSFTVPSGGGALVSSVTLNNGTLPVYATALAASAPRTITIATYPVGVNDTSLIFNASVACTVTLPAAASYPGRFLLMKNIAAFSVSSASANVVPLAGGAAGTSILAGTAGKYVTLQSDGSNWQIMQGN